MILVLPQKVVSKHVALSGNAFDLCMQGARFEFLLGHCLSPQSVLVFFNPSWANSGIQLETYQTPLLLNQSSPNTITAHIIQRIQWGKSY
jgi:hypothetical protein